VVDATVRRGVDLDHIERGSAGPDPIARLAYATRLAVLGPVRTIQRHGEHACRRRLAHTARPAEEVRMRDPAPRDRGLERLRDVLLHGDLAETARPVLAGESVARHTAVVGFNGSPGRTPPSGGRILRPGPYGVHSGQPYPLEGPDACGLGGRPCGPAYPGRTRLASRCLDVEDSGPDGLGGHKRRPRLAEATSAALSAATCGVLTRFVSSRPSGLGRNET